MRVHLPWLEEFVERPDTEALAAHFAQAGIEVEAIDDPRTRCAGVVVARVAEVAAHPSSDKLHVCKVDDGEQVHQVVCGAPNVKAGMVVAYAPVGARLGELQLSARTLRGVVSHGMLCAREELGLVPDGDGLMVLPEDLPLGSDVALACNLAEVLTLGITPNRSDLLGHQGLARELAASTHKRLKVAKWRLIEKGPDVSTQARALVDEPQGCRRYVGRVVHHVKVGPSPLWLRERLAAMGQRSVNNVVDVTNYVMFELNQPLHAYDLHKLQAHQGLPSVRVRRAQAGETLKTLDGVTRTLDESDLVIADGERPVGLAGVMGGANSEVDAGTTHVFLEAACFDPVWVRRMGRRHNLRSEASYRFERGTDVSTLARAIDRAAQLLGELAGGEAAKGLLDVAQRQEGPLELTLRLARVSKILGLQIAAEQVVGLLEPLEIRCVRRTDTALIFAVPTFRNDITREADLIEEVARRYGYANLPERLPVASGGERFRPSAARLGERARAALLAAGLGECVTFAFAPAQAGVPWGREADEAVRLLNPLGEQQAFLRTSLVPGLLQVLRHNVRHGQKGGAAFEIGHVFARTPHAQGAAAKPAEPQVGATAEARAAWLAYCDAQLPTQTARVGLVLSGPRHHGRWYEGGATYEMADVKGAIESLLEAYDVDCPLVYAPCTLPALNPYASATLCLKLAEGPTPVGTFGQLAPDQQKAEGLVHPTFVAELDLVALARAPKRRVMAQTLPKYPPTRRDVAFVGSRQVASEPVRAFLAAHAGGAMGPDVVAEVRLFDVYAGAQVGEDEVSLAFAITYQSRERTLLDAEVNEAFHAAVQKAAEAFGVTVRDGVLS